MVGTMTSTTTRPYPVLGSLRVFDRMVMDVMDLHRHGQLLSNALDQVQRTTRELQRSNASLQHFAGQVSSASWPCSPTPTR